MAKGLSTKEYVNLRIEKAAAVQEATREEKLDQISASEIKAVNDNLYDLRSVKESNTSKFQKFSQEVKDALLSECIYKVYDKACGIMERSSMNERIKKNLVLSFVKENGSANLLSRFRTKTLVLSEFNRLVNKYHKIIIESTDKNNPDSLYGRLYKERFDYETMKNERGDYADQAAKILASKNFSKTTSAYKFYSEGKLPPAHIVQRCERYVTKMFISHLYEAAYYNKYGVMAPNPYVLCFCEGHTDYIGPEVPYESIERDSQ